MSARSTTRPTTSSSTSARLGSARSFHVIDVENLLGAEHILPIAPGFGSLYRECSGAGPDDLLLVGADRAHLFGLRGAFPGAHVVVGTGPDGADDALIDALDLSTIARGHDSIVIASGDHRFAGLAAGARSVGLEVVVLARRAGLHRMLGAQADRVVVFPESVRAMRTELTTAA